MKAKMISSFPEVDRIIFKCECGKELSISDLVKWKEPESIPFVVCDCGRFWTYDGYTVESISTISKKKSTGSAA